MSSPSRVLALVSLAATLAAGAVSALETAEWLGAAEEAEPYVGVRQRVIAAAESVVAANVPESLFLDRLKEGVRKRAASDRLVAALEAEAGRLVFLGETLDASTLRMDAEERKRALSDGALLLRTSVSREEYAAVVGRIAAEGAAADRVSATVAVLSAVDPARVLDGPLRLELADAIARSSMDTGRIDSLVSAFTRGRSFALSPRRIARLIADELASGGTLATIDRALNRERKKR